MPISTAATHTLDQLSIPYSIFEHPKPPSSLEQAARARGQSPDQVVRSILFRFQKEQFFLTLAAGPRQVSWRKLRAHLRLSRISLASEEEVLEITGYAVGSVSPLGLARPTPILADIAVFAVDEISLGSGVRGAAIIMKSVDLKRALGRIDIGQFC
ncbi:MAG: aminoacyl-tRNA deacylase [Anaerolineales bacterium]